MALNIEEKKSQLQEKHGECETQNETIAELEDRISNKSTECEELKGVVEMR